MTVSDKSSLTAIRERQLLLKEQQENGEGYENIIDSDTGKILAVRRATGEVCETETITVPVGTLHFTPEQQELYKQRKEAEALRAEIEHKRSLRREAASPLGKFYFVLSDERFDGVSPETVTRLIFLNTFMNYDNNKLMLSERTPMKRRDLADVLKVSKATVSRFWKEVSPKYITECNDGLMFSNNDTFKRGKLPKGQRTAYHKIYVDGIRKLYNSVETKHHKQLGYFFKLLPFINIEYNLLCYPECILCEDIEDIELISVFDFCKWIGYDVKHLNDLVRTYQSIFFDVGGKAERFCTLVYDGINRKGAKICINPHILYSGSDYNKVEVLGAFYKP